ncbi:MAG: hypothetical protein ABF289_00860 [Clostridiales bacterium]
MKNMKKIVTVMAAVGVVGMASFAYAADIKSPSDIVSSITGKTIEEVQEERVSGKTYGTIAKEADKLDEFKKEILAQKKAVLDQKVKDGILTQEKADEIYKTIEERQITCDGTGSGSIGKENGVGFGQGMGTGSKNGQGKGNRQGGGEGLGNGYCIE